MHHVRPPSKILDPPLVLAPFKNEPASIPLNLCYFQYDVSDHDLLTVYEEAHHSRVPYIEGRVPEDKPGASLQPPPGTILIYSLTLLAVLVLLSYNISNITDISRYINILLYRAYTLRAVTMSSRVASKVSVVAPTF